MPNCDAILYSTRTMRDIFGFRHDFDSPSPSIGCPGRPGIPIVDDGAGFRIPLALVPAGGVPPPSVCRTAIVSFTASKPPPLGPGTTQAILYRRLGFPYLDQWRRVPDSVDGHGLPADAAVTTVPVSDAIVRGRSRAQTFHKNLDGRQPAPGAVFYLDGAGPLIASLPDGYTVYFGAVDGTPAPATGASGPRTTWTLPPPLAALTPSSPTSEPSLGCMSSSKAPHRPF